MAKFLLTKGLQEGGTVKTMTIPDEKLHIFQNCDWYKSGKWVQIIEEIQEEKITVKAKLVDEPTESVKQIKDMTGDLGGDLGGKKRGRKPKN